MKTKKVEEVITTLKDRNGHPLKKHLTEIPTSVERILTTRVKTGANLDVLYINIKNYM